MKLMYPEMRVLKVFLSLLAVATLFAGGSYAQSKRTAAKSTAKKSTAKAKDARKKPAATAKSNARDTKKKSTASKKKEPAKSPKKMTAAERRKEAARQKAEAARRAAALAEQRRREQAAREARARRLAFERGLRTETAENILKDNTEGEDLAVRQVAVNALGERAGTVVVMDAKSGKIVTMVNQDWAIKEGFKPCSTIKLVTGVAGLSENKIEPDGTISGDSMRMDLDDALAYSNNAYFQRVGVRMGTDKMISYARQLGLGEKTGINAEGEYAGKLPYGNSNPRIYSHADDFEVTPLQLAVMVTALSNGGKRITPQFQRSRTERTSAAPKIRGTIELPDSKVERVIPGMIGAAEYGTARRGADQAWGVAGKTGSCIGRGSWVGLFASVAPVEDPKYSVVVITRGEGERGRIAAGIAHQIYRSLAPQLRRDQDRFLALKRQGAQSNTDAMLAAAGDDEEEDEEEAGTNVAELGTEPEDNGRPVVVAGASQRPVNTPVAEPRKTVVRTADSQPKTPVNLAPIVIPYRKDTATTPAAPALKPATVVAKPAASPATAKKPAVKSLVTSKPVNNSRTASKPASTAKPVSKTTSKPVKAAAKTAPKTTARSSKTSTKSNSKTAVRTPAKTTAKNTKPTNKSNAKTSAKTASNSKSAAKPPAKTTSKSGSGSTRPRVVKNR
ncbi:MAG: penicillin-binding transpeptidase domain-containing protein [Pyrinomonadaceae bacterium]|nr:penicillin-binding transpeptidase domain-containing protein [Pyrinomonadaceae bacterium]